jgi:hypothetical protein
MSKIDPVTRRQKFLRAVCLFPIVLAALIGVAGVRAVAEPHLGYGANVAEWDYTLLNNMGFDWIKYYDVPPIDPPPSWAHVLLRITVNKQSYDHLGTFLDDLGYTLAYQDHVDAYEIGNEVNLDASYGWSAAPDAAKYKAVLCAAYAKIKQADPTAIVVSSGLAPTGRVIGNWNGHSGHNGAYQDEREFFKELINAGGGNCLDAVGYHPYGFSADFDAAPDISSTDPAQNCVNGFCFRGVEKIYELMQANGLGNKEIWATEFGWITDPPDYCESQSEWSGRLWQIVSEAKQASNLVGAFQYADEHYPWMGAMFIFNLNFNTAPYYPECEQMRFYSIEGRPAEAALTAMPKNKAPGRLQVKPASILMLIGVNDQPLTQTFTLNFSNTGWQTLRYTVTANLDQMIVPALTNASRNLNSMITKSTTVIISSTDRITGTYTGLLTATASIGALGVPIVIPIELRVVDVLYRSYLPLIADP